MKIFEVDEEGRAVEVYRSRAGRFFEAAGRFAVTLPLVSVLLLAYFMIDVLGPKPMDAERMWGYLASALGLGLIFAVAIGLAGALRTSRWRIDLADRSIAFETRISVGEPRGISVDFQNLKAVRVERAGMGRRSAIVLDFGEDQEDLVATRLGASSLDPVVAALRNLLEDEPVEVVG